MKRSTFIVLAILLISFVMAGAYTKKIKTDIGTNAEIRAYGGGCRIEQKIKIIMGRQSALKTMAGEYVPIIDLTSGGKVFKEAVLKNISEENLTSSKIFAIAKHKNLDLYAIAIYNSSETTVGSIGLYIINMSTMKSYWKANNFSIEIYYCGKVDLPNDGLDPQYLAVKVLDVYWINDTTIVFAYGVNRTDANTILIYTFYYKYSGSPLSGTFTIPVKIFDSYFATPITKDIHSLRLFEYKDDTIGILILADNYVLGDLQFSFYGLILNDTNPEASHNIFSLGTYTGKPYSAYMSNILVDDQNNFYVAMSIANHSILYHIDVIIGHTFLVKINESAINNDAVDPYLYEELTTFDDFGYVPLMTTIDWIDNKSSIIFGVVAYDEGDYYLSYFEDEVNSLGKPVNNITVDTNYDDVRDVLFMDVNITDNETMLFWYDDTNESIYSIILSYENGFRSRRRHLCLNITDGYMQYGVAWVPTHKILIVRKDSNITLSADDSFILISLVNMTDVEESYFLMLTVGLDDTDYDAISNVEEPYYGGDVSLNDTDGDNILDGSELYIYGTALNKSDTDDDSASDYHEIRGVDILGVGIRQTDPLDNDTDNDGLEDGIEMFGKVINTPLLKNIKFYADPLDNDTDDDTLIDSVEMGGLNINVEYANYSAISYTSYSNPQSEDSDGDELSDAREYSLGSDPLLNDTDMDNLTDYLEVIFETNPIKADTDHDYLVDSLEVYGVNITNPHTGETYNVRPDPLDNDSDNDGLLDGEEVRGFNLTIPNVYDSEIVQTNPMNTDCDRDGLSDYEEINGLNISGQIFITDPWDPDTDNDSLLDIDEKVYRTNPISNDTDNDGLSDGAEVNGIYVPAVGKTYYTDPTLNDTDGDNITDFDEINGVYVPSVGEMYYTDPTAIDSDGDGFSDYEEIQGIYIPDVGKTYYTDPTDPDSDNDGLDDYLELMKYSTDPLLNDTDSDNLSDGQEILGVEIPYIGTKKTDPTLPDTDGDNITDYQEFIGIQTLIGVLYSDPTLMDTDFDGLSDYLEVYGWNITCATGGIRTEIHVVSYPNVSDSDYDGLSDYLEYFHKGNPIDTDTDDDMLNDYMEYIYKTLLNDPDTDDDNISDYEEVAGFYIPNIGNVTTDPHLPDTDGDELTDFEEKEGFVIEGIGHVYTDPTRKDTDRDGINDYEEIFIRGTDPTNIDSDDDDLSDYEEVYRYGTDPVNSDSDGDNLSDYDEVFGIEVNGTTVKTDPMKPDSDDDGLSDYQEVRGFDIEGIGLRYTDPNNPDTDGDALLDPDEIEYGTDPTKPDSDSDGLNDYQEVKVYGTNPLKVDTDGDGLSDYEEIKVKRTSPRLADTDGDIFPDSMDPWPQLNNFIVLVLVVVLVALYAAYNYGLFRNWRNDVIAFGLSDTGGVIVTTVAREFKTKVDLSLVSSGLLGIQSLVGEITGKELGSIALAGEVPIYISRGEYSIAWVFLRKIYPRIIKQLDKLHREIERTFGVLLQEWSGMEEEAEDIKIWIASRLNIRVHVESEEIPPELESKFSKEFGEI